MPAKKNNNNINKKKMTTIATNNLKCFLIHGLHGSPPPKNAM